MRLTERIRFYMGRNKRTAVEVTSPEQVPQLAAVAVKMHCPTCGNTDPTSWTKCIGSGCPIMESPHHISRAS